MAPKLSLFILLVGFLSNSQGANFAVLVSGSDGYDNYRHQADICHMYQRLSENGFDKNNIITMMVDDIANNSQNPIQGNIINRPNGSNVYPGVRKDYIGDDVTSANFLDILHGNASGKSLNSTKDDNVFIYMADHGAPGLFCFPECSDRNILYVDDLNATLYWMHTHRRYKKMIIYMEACESGSMFNGYLPPNINIYAITAATPSEPSYAWYWDDYRQTYLGDLFSIRFLENFDQSFPLETFREQYDIVKDKTNESHVCRYGDITVSDVSVSSFIGKRDEVTTDPYFYLVNDNLLRIVYRQLAKILALPAQLINWSILEIVYTRFKSLLPFNDGQKGEYENAPSYRTQLMDKLNIIMSTNTDKAIENFEIELEKFQRVIAIAHSYIKDNTSKWDVCQQQQVNASCIRTIISKYTYPLTVYDLEIISLTSDHCRN